MSNMFETPCFVTPGILSKIPKEDIQKALTRHFNCDWGDLCDEDKEMNDQDFKIKGRLLSAYESSTHIKFWIITDPGWKATTVLLPSEY